MEIQRTQITDERQNARSFADIAGDDSDRERLSRILAVNAALAREKMLFRTDLESMEAALMKNPVPIKKVFAYFGLMLGIFPLASMFLKVLYHGNPESGIVILLFFINLICAVAGYFSGKLIGRMVLELENRSWHSMLLTLPFVGALWGILTGGAGGVFVFVIGAFFGAFIAAMIGSLAIPSFTIFHRLLKRGEMMERNQFLPVAFGITFIISAFILGL